MALVYEGPTDEPEEVYDAVDDEVGDDGLREAVRDNLIMKGYILGQKNPKKFLKNFRSAVGRDDAASDDRGHGLASNIVGQFEEYMNDYYSDGSELSVAPVPGLVEPVLRGLELGNPAEEDVQEAFDELVSEDYYNILAHAQEHLSKNPIGGTDADFDEYIRDAELENFYVSWDTIDDNRRYWTGGGQVDLENEEDIVGDIPDLEGYVQRAMDNNYIYPSSVEEGGALQVYINFEPDYDEQEGFDGFKAFVDQVKEYDSNYDNFRIELIDLLRNDGYFTSEQTKINLERFEELDLDNFEVDLEEGKVSITSWLITKIYLPVGVKKFMKPGVAMGDRGSEERVARDIYLAIMEGLRTNNEKIKDSIISRLQSVLDRALEISASQLKLPLNEEDMQKVGLAIPDYNINIGFLTRKQGSVALGGIGTNEYRFTDELKVWFEVKLEGNEEPEALQIIERFVKMADHDDFVEKLRQFVEGVINNMIIKEIIPEFEAKKREKEQIVAESRFSSFGGHKNIFNEWRKFTKG